MDTLIKKELEEYGQSHLVDQIISLKGQEGAKDLVNDVNHLDLRKLRDLFRTMVLKKADQRNSLGKIDPLPICGQFDSDDANDWKQSGEHLLKQGKAAAFLVAGGQGSRLGFEGPKGIFDIGLPSGKSLFQLQAERIFKLQLLYGHVIPWYIMTSPLNHKDTTEFFEANNYFGLMKRDIFFFNQGMLPALDDQGRVLLESESKVTSVPDGNGGCFMALNKSGALADMQKRGIEYVFLYSVDNSLVKICDPLFLGFLAESGAPCASKVVPKKSWDEKVGIFAQIDGKPGVIEYSDIPEDMVKNLDEDGNLVFDGGNIAVHAFTMEALKQIADTPLPYHVAHKKVKYYSPTDDKMISPKEPNAWKFEQFLFDAFPQLGRMDTLLVDRTQDFAPVKNAEGNDSPVSARKMIGELHRSWLAQHVLVDENMLYEVPATLSYDGEGLSKELIEEELTKGQIKSYHN